jgi:phosphoribosyl-AMP cyclohydrolase
MMKYGKSWLVQSSDRSLLDGVSGHVLLFVLLDGRIATVLGSAYAMDIAARNLFEDTVVKSYSHSKKAIYYKSLEAGGVPLNVLELGAKNEG